MSVVIRLESMSFSSFDIIFYPTKKKKKDPYPLLNVMFILNPKTRNKTMVR